MFTIVTLNILKVAEETFFIDLFLGKGLDLDNIVKDELDTIKEIHENYSCLKNVPLVNDEADPLKSWWKDFIWRAGTELLTRF